MVPSPQLLLECSEEHSATTEDNCLALAPEADEASSSESNAASPPQKAFNAK